MSGESSIDAYAPTDQLVACIERSLRAKGATFDDIDERIAAELGVPPAAWSGYLAVKFAAERYQTRQRRRSQSRGLAQERE